MAQNLKAILFYEGMIQRSSSESPITTPVISPGGEAAMILPKVISLIEHADSDSKTRRLVRSPRKRGYGNKPNSIVVCDVDSVSQRNMSTLEVLAGRFGLTVGVWQRGTLPEVYFTLSP